jgi:hypothetical protein
MKPLPSHSLVLSASLLALLLSACDRSAPPPAPPAANATPAEPAPPAPPTAASVAAAPVDASSIDAPIDPIQIATRIELVGEPVHVHGNDMLVLRLRVHNDGRHILVSAGTHMVHLGTMLVGPQGVDTPPGNRDFVRTRLPLLQPGSSAEVDAELPVPALLGLPLRLELVQEGVSWFGAYGEPSLDLGPYTRCAEDPIALCDPAGAPIASR